MVVLFRVCTRTRGRKGTIEGRRHWWEGTCERGSVCVHLIVFSMCLPTGCLQCLSVCRCVVCVQHSRPARAKYPRLVPLFFPRCRAGVRPLLLLALPPTPPPPPPLLRPLRLLLAAITAAIMLLAAFLPSKPAAAAGVQTRKPPEEQLKGWGRSFARPTARRRCAGTATAVAQPGQAKHPVSERTITD